MNKQIKLLKKQIAKLDENDFDLEVWKISTKLLLEKIFGKNSSEIKQINDISGDMSSWTLRDNLGENKSDRSKLLGKQILETCIDELELSENDSVESGNEDILIILKNELKGSQFEKINDVIKEKIQNKEKVTKLNSLLKEFGIDNLANILAIYLSK